MVKFNNIMQVKNGQNIHYLISDLDTVKEEIFYDFIKPVKLWLKADYWYVGMKSETVILFHPIL